MRVAVTSGFKPSPIALYSGSIPKDTLPLPEEDLLRSQSVGCDLWLMEEDTTGGGTQEILEGWQGILGHNCGRDTINTGGVAGNTGTQLGEGHNKYWRNGREY